MSAPTLETAKEFKLRVGLSDDGIKQLVTGHHGSKMHADIGGTMLGVARNGCLVVLFDGYKTVHSYHPSFLVAIREE